MRLKTGYESNGAKVCPSKFLGCSNEKAPEYSFKGFIFGGSGEIRTRDQRYLGHKLALFN
jgi:hypothetical protein